MESLTVGGLFTKGTSTSGSEIHYHPCMPNPGRVALILPLLVAALLYGAPASAQVDFTGVWNGNTNAEDGPERAAGPSLVEFLGLPVNEQGRQWGLSYRPGRLSLTEHQCQVHIVHYIHRGPFAPLICS